MRKVHIKVLEVRKQQCKENSTLRFKINAKSSIYVQIVKNKLQINGSSEVTSILFISKY